MTTTTTTTTAPAFKKSVIREYFESIVIAVILALFIRTFVLQAFKIPTGSMENNLLIGDHLLVNKFAMGPTASGPERSLLPVRTIRRGDVLVLGAERPREAGAGRRERLETLVHEQPGRPDVPRVRQQERRRGPRPGRSTSSSSYLPSASRAACACG